MKKRQKTLGVQMSTTLLLLMGCLVGTASLASLQAKDKKIRLQGVVLERHEGRLAVQDLEGRKWLVRLTPGTEIEEDKKNFLREPLVYKTKDLIRGLRVKVKGRLSSDGTLLARSVKFRQSDLRVAGVVDANLVPLDSRIGELQGDQGWLAGQAEELGNLTRATRSAAGRAQNTADLALSEAQKAHQRVSETEAGLATLVDTVSELDNYQIAHTLTIHFEAASSELASQATQQLDKLVPQPQWGQNYLVEITGFASAEGAEYYNRLLSQKRAEVVFDYLLEKHQISLRNLIRPHGFGELRPVADNQTREGRRENRRVEVRVLVNRGFQKMAQAHW